MFWFDKNDPRALFVDKRCEDFGKVQNGQYLNIAPDMVADFTDLPFAENSFQMVVFDPPHHTSKRMGKTMTGTMSRKYGVLLPGWESMLAAGFSECFRVLKPHGTLIFKWCSFEIPLNDVLRLTPEKPLFGHNSGKQMKTHWIAFLKP